MIEKYYTVMVKDKEGFKHPLLNEKGVPDLYVNAKLAGEQMFFLRRIYEIRLKSNPVKKTGFRGLLGSKEVQPTFTEEQKKEMRWFIANSSVQGVTLTV